VLRERVSEDIFVFTSELYAQVTAGLIVTSAGAVVIDTMPFPSESRGIASLGARVCRAGVRYVVLTHYHADHAYGAYLFPSADLVAHARCRELLASVGAPALESAKADEPELQEVSIRLPEITFDGDELALQLGGRTLRLIHMPGHTQDMVMLYVEDARVLFAGDTVMPVPSIVDGDLNALRAALTRISSLQVENLVQGHGEVILRGEVQDVLKLGLSYLDAIEARVDKVVKSQDGREALQRITIEACGLSRIPLGGLVQHIHRANLAALYTRMSGRAA
jgi:cyclase